MFLAFLKLKKIDGDVNARTDTARFVSNDKKINSVFSAENLFVFYKRVSDRYYRVRPGITAVLLSFGRCLVAKKRQLSLTSYIHNSITLLCFYTSITLSFSFSSRCRRVKAMAQRFGQQKKITKQSLIPF